MKITDLTLTLFAWEDIPVLSYGAHSGTLQQGSKLGLLAIETDAGITGHAFLGSAMYPADMDAAALIRFLKPIVLGQDPMNRELLNQRMWKASAKPDPTIRKRCSSRQAIDRSPMIVPRGFSIGAIAMRPGRGMRQANTRSSQARAPLPVISYFA